MTKILLSACEIAVAAAMIFLPLVCPEVPTWAYICLVIGYALGRAVFPGSHGKSV